ncbi:hypothetical protein AURDEDRAFT_180640 [Auricularia subglabra TFB-10046 SS5]|nr:hypothetical protein AURDEDRAFT_180640 [Auricularia subglabra TFB-10046 SS5]
MRVGASSHLLSTRAFDQRYPHPGGRRHINIELLLDELESIAGADHEDEATVSNGSKRPLDARSSPLLSSPSRKRVKLDEELARNDDTHRVVYTHAYTFGFTTTAEDAPPAAYGTKDIAVLAQEEGKLVQYIEQLNETPDGPASVTLGPVTFHPSGHDPLVLLRKHSERLAQRQINAYSEERIMLCPSFSQDGFDVDDHGFALQHQDVLRACIALQTAGYARVTGYISLSHLQHVELEEDELPFQLHLNMHVALTLPPPDPLRLRHDIAEAQRRVMAFLIPSEPIDPAYNYTQTDTGFYYSVLKPAPPLPSVIVADALQPDALLPTLLPFQRRSVAVMLAQEGKVFDASGMLQSKDPTPQLPLMWKRLPSPWETDDSETIYYNRLTGALLTEPPVIRHYPGLFVAEEMGLGKTLECIALLLLNPLRDRNPAKSRWDPEAEVEVAEVPTSLIVTPPSLAQQWVDECNAHAPALRVFTYQGWNKFAKDMASYVRDQQLDVKPHKVNGRKGKSVDSDADSMDLDVRGREEKRAATIANFFHQNVDVVVTTYNVLQQDLGVARAPVKRPRRAASNYSNVVERHRSPLICVEWGRLIMDEAQLVGGGKAAEMVSLIPRLASFAVSGTPAKANVGDLYNTLKFLRVPDIVPSSRHWNRLLLPGFAEEFAALFSSLTVRTLKSQVKNELTIPPQSRVLVPVSLGRVERHVYGGTLDASLQALGIGLEGARLDTPIDATILRNALKSLRGLCTHPQVGQLQRADKGGNVLRSIGEVLERMTDQNWKDWMEHRKERIAARTRHAQLLRRDERLPQGQRDRRALDILLSVRAECEQQVSDIKSALETHLQKHKPVANGSDKADNVNGKGKGRAASLESAADDDTHGLFGQPLEEYRSKARGLSHRLRESYVDQHKAVFLLGDVYHCLGADFAAAEDAAYQAAEELRKTLLRATESIAEEAMSRLERDAQKLKTPPQDLQIEECPQGGIRSADLMEEGNEILDILQDQGELLLNWRQKLVELLVRPLSNRQQQADGEEYNVGLETQAQAEVYLQAYAALLADRRETLTSDRTTLATHDDRSTRLRLTNVAARANLPEAYQLDLVPEPLDSMNLDNPEQEVMLSELMSQRKRVKDDRSNRSLRMVMVDLNRIMSRVGDRKEETEIARMECQRLRTAIAHQERILEKFEAELPPLRRAFNERVQYFRQLQELSDTVAEVEWEGNLADELEELEADVNKLDGDIRTTAARLRYLQHMAEQEQEDEPDEDRHCCILCGNEFSQGLMTPCAHVFCEECITLWLKRGSKACPVCRVPITSSSMHRITVQENKAVVANGGNARSGEDDVVAADEPKIAFNMLDGPLYKKIQSTVSHGSYGSKIELLIKHLLYIREEDPGAKSIVFSAWADSLHIIEHALIHNNIPCLRVDAGKSKENAARKFRTDPHLLVFLLHGERENAGLNVTCAQRVFLVEPVVNHAFEVQGASLPKGSHVVLTLFIAISRIDRMGQTHNTEVFCYFAEDTVEENILNLAARQGLSLYTEDQSHGTLDATALITGKTNIDSPSKRKKTQKGDFVAKTEDMLAIMFPHVFRPQTPALVARTNGTAHKDRYTTPDAFSGNAIAGPSRV